MKKFLPTLLTFLLFSFALSQDTSPKVSEEALQEALDELSLFDTHTKYYNKKNKKHIREQFTLRDGKRHGPYFAYYISGVKKTEGYYYNNKKDGWFDKYNDRGEITESIQYHNGSKKAYRTYSHSYNKDGEIGSLTEKGTIWGAKRQKHLTSEEIEHKKYMSKKRSDDALFWVYLLGMGLSAYEQIENDAQNAGDSFRQSLTEKGFYDYIDNAKKDREEKKYLFGHEAASALANEVGSIGGIPTLSFVQGFDLELDSLTGTVRLKHLTDNMILNGSISGRDSFGRYNILFENGESRQLYKSTTGTWYLE